METWQAKLKPFYDTIQNYLARVLRDRTPSVTLMLEEPYPLLIMVVNQDVAGFAVVNGNAKEGYQTAYSRFKDLYSKRHAEWADRNLSFVLCRTEQTPELDNFFNKIEIDVYFCRKFVIYVSNDQEQLGMEASRLPFLPMDPSSAGEMRRPPSAQSLLQSLGVLTELAKYLIVPQRRSEDGIVTDCLSGKFKRRDLDDIRIIEFCRDNEPSRTIRMKSITIEDFRAYKGNHHFDLDADLIILYGPNGVGKTSFFDAVDFACTGRIGRLQKSIDSPGMFRKVVSHLDSIKDSARVQMKIASLNKWVKSISRKVSDCNTALINGEEKDRKSLLMWLTNATWEDSTMRVENLATLFRASHFFGQDYQELLTEFRENSQLSQDVVARMLAFEDYVAGSNKIRKVCDTLKRKRMEKVKETEILREKIREKKEKLKHLKGAMQLIDVPDAIDSLAQGSAEKLKVILGNEILTPSTIGKNEVRGWRAQLASKIDLLSEQLKLIANLKERFGRIADVRQDKVERNQNLINLQNQIQGLRASNAELHKRIEDLNKNKAHLQASEKSLQESRDTYLWRRREKQRLEELRIKKGELAKSAAEITSRLLELNKKIEILESKQHQVTLLYQEKTKSISTEKAKTEQLAWVRDKLFSWEENIAKREQLRQEVRTLRDGFDKDDAQRLLVIEKYNAQKASLVEAESAIKIMQQSESKLLALLDELETHITDSLCPACGTDHQSKEILIQRLRSQRGARSPETERAVQRFHEIRKSTENIKLEKENLDRLISQRREREQRLAQSIEYMTSEISRFEKMAEGLDIPLEALELRKVIEQRLRDLDRQDAVMSTQIREMEKQTNDAQAVLNSLYIEREEWLSQEEKQKSRLAQTEDAIEKILLEASSRAISFEIDYRDISRSLTSIELDLFDSQQKLQLIKDEITTAEEKIASHLKSQETSESEIQKIERLLLNYASTIEDYEQDLARAFLARNINLNDLLERKNYLEKKLSDCHKLASEVILLEKALDVAETSATIQQLEQEQEADEKALELVEQDEREMKGWISYFTDLRKRLDEKRESSIRNYTEKYGPLTSVIQKRLRAVYGFGDITLNATDGEIHVQVARQNKGLRPTDYFSDSQKQILMLSLFLSAGITQAWSSFAPIFLDDPVTHFDDLNAYAFVDLIRGLIEGKQLGSQFIISTCEERLFRLMRHKFERLGNRAIIYEFLSIGGTGPEIRQIQ